jgi:hypothetical protein
MSFR